MKTTKCPPTLQRTSPPIVPDSGVGDLGLCGHGKWPQREVSSNMESSVSASTSPSKHHFTGLLIKFTDGVSDGCPETRGAETAEKRPRNPSTTSLMWFPNLALHSYPLPSFLLTHFPTTASQACHEPTLPTSVEMHSLKGPPGLEKIIINLIGWWNYIK